MAILYLYQVLARSTMATGDERKERIGGKNWGRGTKTNKQKSLGGHFFAVGRARTRVVLHRSYFFQNLTPSAHAYLGQCDKIDLPLTYCTRQFSINELAKILQSLFLQILIFFSFRSFIFNNFSGLLFAHEKFSLFFIPIAEEAAMEEGPISIGQHRTVLSDPSPMSHHLDQEKIDLIPVAL